jgi:hypothetical protein
MTATREERTKRLQRLLSRKEEGPDLDYKQDLYLDSDGDKAEFVKDVLALANSTELGHIVTGVEDKTWRPVGITRHHDQVTLNDVLKDKTDPRIQVEYVELEVEGVQHGLMTIDANNPPYLVAVADRYGGKVSTHAQKQVHIVRGTVFVRIQDKNDGASRVHLDAIYSQSLTGEDKGQESARLYLASELKEMASYPLEDKDTFIQLVVYPLSAGEPMLDRRSLSDPDFLRGFKDVALSVNYEPPRGGGAGPLSALRYARAGEDTVQLLQREGAATPEKLLKMDVRGRISWGYLLSSEEVEFFQLRAACDWLFRVAAKLYEKYDVGRVVDRVGIQLRLRSFAHKLLAVQLSLPGFFNYYRCDEPTDPRVVPEDPIEAPVDDLDARHGQLADELMDYVKRSYHQVG